jgi:hypothetical protein
MEADMETTVDDGITIVCADESGASLLELLVVQAVFAVVSSALFMVFATGTVMFSYGTKAATAQSDLAGSLSIVLDDVSAAGCSPDGALASSPCAPGGGLASSAALQALPAKSGCLSSSDTFAVIGDVAPLGDSNLVSYTLDSSNNLLRTVQRWNGTAWTAASTGPSIVAANVSCFQVLVLDASDTEISSQLQNARYVETILTTTDNGVKGGIPLAKSLFGKVALRNFN